MAKKKQNWEDSNLLFIVLYALIMGVIVMLLIIFDIQKSQRAVISPYSGEELGYAQPVVVEVPEDLNAVTEEVHVVRDVYMKANGAVVVEARLEGVGEIDRGVVLQDFVEEIKFSEHVEVKGGHVQAENGVLFPPGDKISVSSYGPGAVRNKSTKITVALLDLNFDRKSDETGLYSLEFYPDKKVQYLIFEGGEFRSGKYILKLEEEILPVLVK